MSLLKLPPLSLYIHIPWCVRKCPYCDFNSHTTEALPEQDYIKALIDDLEQELAFVQQRPLTSIFFGGGTPSLFSAESINNILNAVEKRIPFAEDIEITLEANPGTRERNKFAGYRQAGVNRLSIGVQSFQPQHLQTLGRIHNQADAIEAITLARQAGFDNFNIDLMHGLPDQSTDNALADLSQAIAQGATHLSWYQLTIEPNTAFYNTPPQLPEDDQLADIQQAGEQLLQQHGFSQYEISAYSQQRPSQHNLNYWQFGDYLGIGAGAHGKVSQLSQGAISRRWKTRAPRDYLNPDKAFLAGQRTLNKDELPLEFMMNALRLNQGFSQKTFETSTGLPLDTIRPTLQALEEQGLLYSNQHQLATTDLGRRFLNSILEQF